MRRAGRPSSEMARSGSGPPVPTVSPGRGVMVSRTTAGGADDARVTNQIAVAPTTNATATNNDSARALLAGTPTRRRRPHHRAHGSCASSISSRADAASASRRLRSFSRQRRSSVRMDGGVWAGAPPSPARSSTPPPASRQSSPPRTRAAPSAFRRARRRRPRYRRAYRRASPRACSGDMYAAVPRIIPGRVIAGVVIVGDSA